MCVQCVIRKFAQLYGLIPGIDANPRNVEAIEQLQPPHTLKEIQKLAGMMAALSRFISLLGERGMPFYKLLCNADGFQ
jgi:hypothetical protein